MFRNKSRFLLLLLLLSYAVRWIGIRFLGSEIMLRATPVHVVLLALLLLPNVWQEKKTMLWMTGVLGAGAAAGWAAAGFKTALPASAFLDAGYQMIFLTGICSVVTLSGLPVWQKTASVVLLSLVLKWLLAPVAVPLGYGALGSGLFSGNNWLYWSSVAALASGSWFPFRLKPVHFAIALLLAETVFLALLRL